MDGFSDQSAPRLEIGEDMLQALGRNGGPLILTRNGEDVAAVLSLEALEELEDRGDAAAVREARARWRDEGLPEQTLEQVAEELGVDLDRS